jgi:hypothetical protein
MPPNFKGVEWREILEANSGAPGKIHLWGDFINWGFRAIIAA